MTEQERRTAQTSNDQAELNELALKLFHRLWGKDKDTSSYDKGDWMALQTVLLKLGVKV